MSTQQCGVPLMWSDYICVWTCHANKVELITSLLRNLQPVFIQSFETKNLQQIRPLTNLPLVQLLSGVNVSGSLPSI